MNNLKQILILVFLLFVSCGKNSSNSNTYTYNSVTLTGTISDASSGSSSLAISGSETDYLIMAQNQISNRIYLTQIESDGTFKFNSEGAIHTSIETVDHPSGHGDHFMFTLIKKDPLELKAIAFQEDSTSEGYSGIKIDTSLSESIQFAYSESDHKITVSETQLNSVNGISINKDFKVRLSNGKPVGIDDFGKSEISKTTDKSSSNILDPDQDGRPNIFDGMNDGANIDNLSEANKTEAATISDSIESSIMFMNLKIDYEDKDSFTVTDNAVIVLEVKPKSTASISSIRVAELNISSSGSIRLLHTNYKTAVIEKIPNGFTAIDTYPAENSNWSDNDYKLFKATNMTDEVVYTVLIKPKNNNFKPGDLILLEVNLTDGTKEFYFNSLNFKFQTIPTDQTNWTHGGSGSSNDPFKILDSGGRTFTWDNPLDETGIGLSGLSYKFEVFYYKETSGACSPNYEAEIINMVIISDRESGVTDKNDISESEIDQAGSTTKCIQLDIAGSYPYGDNAALKYFIERNSW